MAAKRRRSKAERRLDPKTSTDRNRSGVAGQTQGRPGLASWELRRQKSAKYLVAGASFQAGGLAFEYFLGSQFGTWSDMIFFGAFGFGLGLILVAGIELARSIRERRTDRRH